VALQHWQFPRAKNQSEASSSPAPGAPKIAAYQRIAEHYRWILEQVFDVMGYRQVIMMEDDLDVAPDFLEYFRATLEILRMDPTLWCVSAWNDQGMKKFVKDSELIRRTNFFPGLGWMLTAELWNELAPKWPKGGYYDDWMREKEQRKDRDCLYPEVARTYTFGSEGSSGGQFWKVHLRNVKLNDEPIPFTQKNLSYLLKVRLNSSLLVSGMPLLTSSPDRI
jgi:alpha-1,3-mannosyl-glycoprotein beta-1,2-N-acetylglucosaminyltransferase